MSIICIQLSTLRGATILNTVMSTLPISSVVKSNLFIRALLLDRILVTEKTTRTPRVLLVNAVIITVKCKKGTESIACKIMSQHNIFLLTSLHLQFGE